MESLYNLSPPVPTHPYAVMVSDLKLMRQPLVIFQPSSTYMAKLQFGRRNLLYIISEEVNDTLQQCSYFNSG